MWTGLIWLGIRVCGSLLYTRWFKYDRDKLWLVYTQIVPVIFEPPCTWQWHFFSIKVPKLPNRLSYYQIVKRILLLEVSLRYYVFNTTEWVPSGLLRLPWWRDLWSTQSELFTIEPRDDRSRRDGTDTSFSLIGRQMALELGLWVKSQPCWGQRVAITSHLFCKADCNRRRTKESQTTRHIEQSPSWKAFSFH